MDMPTLWTTLACVLAEAQKGTALWPPFSSSESLTAWATILTSVIGMFALGGIYVAAAQYRLESSPLLVIKAAKDTAEAESYYEIFVNIDAKGFSAFSEVISASQPHPYLGLDPTQLRFPYRKVEIENVGRSPAVDVRIDVTCIDDANNTVATGKIILRTILPHGKVTIMVGAHHIDRAVALHFPAAWTKSRVPALPWQSNRKVTCESLGYFSFAITDERANEQRAVEGEGLRSVPTDKLIRKATDLSASIRKLDETSEKLTHDILLSSFQSAREGMTNEQRTAQFGERAETILAASRERQREWDTNYKVQVAVILDELYRRLRATPKQITAIEFGQLAGPRPLRDVADELDRLSEVYRLSQAYPADGP